MEKSILLENNFITNELKKQSIEFLEEFKSLIILGYSKGLSHSLINDSMDKWMTSIIHLYYDKLTKGHDVDENGLFVKQLEFRREHGILKPMTIPEIIIFFIRRDIKKENINYSEYI